MPRLALGLIETVGLAAAVEAADAALKSANVKLIGYELTKGGGLVTIKFEGEVGAVNAAVQAGCAASAKVNKVYSSMVIPRPHDELDVIVLSRETVGIEKLKEDKVESIEGGQALENEKVSDDESNSQEEEPEPEKEIREEQNEEESTDVQNEPEDDEEVEEFDDNEAELGDGLLEVEDVSKDYNSSNIKNIKVKSNKKVTCNLCNDSNCTRKKGEPKTLCIHYKNDKMLKEE